MVVEGHAADALSNGGTHGAVVGEREEVALGPRAARLGVEVWVPVPSTPDEGPVPLVGVPPFVLVKAYGGSPPPFDQPRLARLVALLKPKAVVGCEGGGEGGEEGGEGSEGSGGGGGGGEVGGEGGGMPTTAISTGSH